MAYDFVALWRPVYVHLADCRSDGPVCRTINAWRPATCILGISHSRAAVASVPEHAFAPGRPAVAAKLFQQPTAQCSSLAAVCEESPLHVAAPCIEVFGRCYRTRLVHVTAARRLSKWCQANGSYIIGRTGSVGWQILAFVACSPAVAYTHTRLCGRHCTYATLQSTLFTADFFRSLTPEATMQAPSRPSLWPTALEPMTWPMPSRPVLDPAPCACGRPSSSPVSSRCAAQLLRQPWIVQVCTACQVAASIDPVLTLHLLCSSEELSFSAVVSPRPSNPLSSTASALPFTPPMYCVLGSMFMLVLH